jgi:hypothetical protein
MSVRDLKLRCRVAANAREVVGYMSQDEVSSQVGKANAAMR